jgi:uncharacterized protein (TIGR02679 family)
MTDEIYALAAAYFQQRPVLSRLASGFCEKYRSLGHWGGSIRLENLTPEDNDALSSFLRESMMGRKAVSVRYAVFAAAWEKTKFAALPVGNFLAHFYPQQLLTKKEEAISRQRQWEALLDALLAAYPAAAAQQWLQALKERRLRAPHAEAEDGRSAELLALVAGALSRLPSRYERLPFFANRVTGNPHVFDWDCEAGKQLLQALAFLSGQDGCHTVDEKTELLYRYRLLRDDILNFATEVGLCAWTNERELSYWQAAAQSHSPLNVPFREIVRADRIVPYMLSGRQSEPLPFRVYIVENSGVFSTLLDALPRDGRIPPLLCLHGQLKTASWALLDRLAESGGCFCYSGDFDPEGLLIVQKLRQRYPGKVQLWHFSLSEYSRTDIRLTSLRLKRLDGITDAGLTPIAVRMRDWQCAFYQESLLSVLLHDLMLDIAAHSIG